MTSKEIRKFEQSQCKQDATKVSIGDTVIVHKVIMEGKKQRVQRFQR